MLNFPRYSLRIFGFLFAMDHLGQGLAWWHIYNNLSLAWLTYGMYFLLACLLVLYPGGFALPKWVAGLGLAGSVAISTMALGNLDVSKIPPAGSFATWFVGGVSALLAILAVRNNRLLAFVGLAVLLVQMLLWGGWQIATTAGLVGAIILVGSSAGLGRGVEIAVERAAVFRSQALVAAARAAESHAARNEREAMLTAALAKALPLLERIIASKGKLSLDYRRDAAVVSQELRDDLLAQGLINSRVRLAINDARRRGVKVALSDQGGLDDLSQTDREEIYTSIAHAIEGTSSGTINIKSVQGENYRVAIVAQRPGAQKPDLWLRLP